MSMQTKYDLLDFIIKALKEHEKHLDYLACRLEEIVDLQEMQLRKSF